MGNFAVRNFGEVGESSNLKHPLISLWLNISIRQTFLPITFGNSPNINPTKYSRYMVYYVVEISTSCLCAACNCD